MRIFPDLTSPPAVPKKFSWRWLTLVILAAFFVHVDGFNSVTFTLPFAAEDEHVPLENEELLREMTPWDPFTYSRLPPSNLTANSFADIPEGGVLLPLGVYGSPNNVLFELTGKDGKVVSRAVSKKHFAKILLLPSFPSDLTLNAVDHHLKRKKALRISAASGAITALEIDGADYDLEKMPRVNIYVNCLGAISGSISGINGNTFSNAFLVVYSDHGEFHVRTDENGGFHFPYLPQGRYRLHISRIDPRYGNYHIKTFSQILSEYSAALRRKNIKDLKFPVRDRGNSNRYVPEGSLKNLRVRAGFVLGGLKLVGLDSRYKEYKDKYIIHGSVDIDSEHSHPLGFRIDTDEGVPDMSPAIPSIWLDYCSIDGVGYFTARIPTDYAERHLEADVICTHPDYKTKIVKLKDLAGSAYRPARLEFEPK